MASCGKDPGVSVAGLLGKRGGRAGSSQGMSRLAGSSAADARSVLRPLLRVFRDTKQENRMVDLTLGLILPSFEGSPLHR